MKKSVKKIRIAAALVALIAVVSLGLLTACADQKDNKLLIVVPDGAPAFAMAELLSENRQFDGVEVEYKVVSPAQLSDYMNDKGEGDIAIMPTDRGIKLYNKGEDVRLVGATTFGNMYLVSRDPAVTTLIGLQGQEVSSIGLADVPEYLLKYLLKRNKVENVTISFGQAPEIKSLILEGKVQIALLGEPAATGVVGQLKQKGVQATVIDLQAEWGKVTGKDSYPQSALFTRAAIAQKYPEVIKAITDSLKASGEWLSDSENLGKANQTMLEMGGTSKLPNVSVVPKIRVGFVSASEIKSELNEFIGIMGGMDPKFIAYKFPDDGFYL